MQSKKAVSSTLSIRLDGAKIVVNYRKLHSIEVKYFLMDLEILFSLKPFILQNQSFDIIEPNYLDEIKLDSQKTSHEVEINKYAKLHNCFVEVRNAANQLSESVFYFNCSLQTQLYENIGNIDVFLGDPETQTKAFVQGVYIKVFAKMKNQTEEFYKDGYTDVAGRFDYASISVDKLKHVEKFAILVSHEVHGSKILECRPPLNI